MCRLLLIAAAILALSTDAALAQEVIGRVKTAEGAAFIVAKGARERAVPGDALRASDVLETGPGGSLGATLKDNTLLSLGPDSRLELATYAFEPDKGVYALSTRMTKGTLHFVSGLISKLSPDTATVETPSGTIGIRGTRFVLRVDGEAKP